MRHILILGKRWLLRFAPNLKNDADCDPPWKAQKEIRIRSELRGRELLDRLIHECTHAAFWHLDETYVEEFATDVAAAITAPEVWERLTDGELLATPA